MQSVTVTLFFEMDERVATRSFTLPTGINPDRIDFKDENGDTISLDVEYIVVTDDGKTTLEMCSFNNDLEFEDVLACGFIEQKTAEVAEENRAMAAAAPIPTEEDEGDETERRGA